MSEKKKQSAINTLASILIDRAGAAKIYFSGELERKRKQLLESGDIPYRILRYQRIVDPNDLSYPIGKTAFVLPSTFENHLKYLTSKCLVLPLEELFLRVENGSDIPDNTVAITIDGGWADSFAFAAPAIKKYSVPVTMFLPTAFIGTDNFPWQDKVLLGLLAMGKLGGPFIPLDFFTDAEIAFLAEISPSGEISVDFAFRVVSILGQHSPAERRVALEAIGEIMRHFQIDLPTEAPFMTWEEVKTLSSLSIKFGSLSHRNAPLLELSPQTIKDDIYLSLNELDSRLGELQNGRAISSVFAVPDGVITEFAIKELQNQSLRRIVGISGLGKPSYDENEPLLLPRLPIYEGCSFSTEALACYLWYTSGVDSL